jgi:hypothetical protein
MTLKVVVVSRCAKFDIEQCIKYPISAVAPVTYVEETHLARLH